MHLLMRSYLGVSTSYVMGLDNLKSASPLDCLLLGYQIETQSDPRLFLNSLIGRVLCLMVPKISRGGFLHIYLHYVYFDWWLLFFPAFQKDFFSSVTIFQDASGSADRMLSLLNTESEVVRWFWQCAPALGLTSTSFRSPTE